MLGMLSDGILGKNFLILQILIDYDIILRVHLSSKVSKLNIFLYCRKRLDWWKWCQTIRRPRFPNHI